MYWGMSKHQLGTGDCRNVPGAELAGGRSCEGHVDMGVAPNSAQ